MDWSYPKFHKDDGNWDWMTEDEANLIPWKKVKQNQHTIDHVKNTQNIEFRFPATCLSDRLPKATEVMLYSCPMHSFMMGTQDRLGSNSPVRLFAGNPEICMMIKRYIPVMY